MMAWTKLKHCYPFIKEIALSGVFGGLCGYAAFGISKLLGFEATNQAMFMMIAGPLYLSCHAFRIHGKACIQKSPVIPSLLLATMSTLLILFLNNVFSINVSTGAIVAIAFSVYLVNVIYIPIKYPHYRIANPTIEEKLKDMHG